MFLVREMRREDRPLPRPLLYGTPLSLDKQNKGKEELSIQADALSTLYFLWAGSKGQPLWPRSSALFLPSFLPCSLPFLGR